MQQCLKVPGACTPAFRQQRRSSRLQCLAKASAGSDEHAEQTSRRAMIGVAGMAAAALLTTTAPAHAEPFLASTGGKGILAQEEQKLYNLRLEREGEARREILAEKERFEQEARSSQIGKLCATPFGIDIVGITEFIALVGALVGGITARQRKAELERLNEQLRKINMSLRQQARAGTVYAPGLSYAPPTSSGNGAQSYTNGNTAAEPFTKAAVTATVTAPRPQSVVVSSPTTAPAERSLFSMEEDEMTSDQIQCRDALRAGKRLLKEGNGSAAMVRFEKALMLSKALRQKVQERRATRGLAAAARLQGQYKTAIGHLERVLEISKQMQEFTGDSDAYGTIADCFTDLGEFEKAAEFYDKYIQCMAKDGPV